MKTKIKNLLERIKSLCCVEVLVFVILVVFIIAVVAVVINKFPKPDENEENKFEYKERELVYYKDETGKQCCYTNTGKYSCLSGHDVSVRMYYPDPNSPDKKKLIVTKDFYLIREVYKVEKDE